MKPSIRSATKLCSVSVFYRLASALNSRIRLACSFGDAKLTESGGLPVRLLGPA
jgi:hypothetical protein